MPHLAEQRRIVDLVGAFDAQQGALVAESSRLSGTYQQLLASCIASGREAAHSRVVRLAECLVLDLEISKVEPGAEYRIAGVLNAGQGLIDKGVVTADTTGYSRLHRLTADKLVMRRLTAWEGPIAVIPPEFNGYFASAEFPTFAIDPNLILPEFMAHVCRWPGLWDEMRQRVTGSVQRRKRLSPSQLMDAQLQLPEIPVQAAFGQALTALEQTRRATEKEGRTVAVARARLLRDLLDSTLEIPKSYDSLLESA